MKTLVLGCSFMGGAYDNNDISVKDSSWIHSLNPKTCDAFYFPGGGMVTYMQFMEEMKNQGRLQQYNNVIMQHTTEPRIISENPSLDINLIFRGMMACNDDLQSLNKIGVNYFTMPTKYTNNEEVGDSLNLVSVHRHTGFLQKYPNTQQLNILEFYMDATEGFTKFKTDVKIAQMMNTSIAPYMKENNLNYIPFFWYGRGHGGNHATPEDFVVYNEVCKKYSISKDEWYENTNGSGHQNRYLTSKINPVILHHLKSNKHLTNCFE